MWFFIALAGYFLLALVAILDKFILTKSVGKPVVYTFYSTIFMFGALLFWPLGVELLHGTDWLWAIISGMAFGFGLWTFYKAIKEGEATHITPFNGAIIIVTTFVLSALFLAEQLNSVQLAGMIILVFACFLLTFEKSLKHKGFHLGFLWAIVSGLFFATSHVTAKYLYELYPFLTGFVWSKATIGLVGLLVIFFPSVRHSFKRRKTKKSKTVAKRHAVVIVIINKILSVGSVILVQWAIALGSATLVMALAGVQYVLMFVIAYLFSKFLRKFFQEYFTKREIAVQLVALVLVILGSALLVF